MQLKRFSFGTCDKSNIHTRRMQPSLREKGSNKNKKISRETGRGANEWCRKLASNLFAGLLNSL